MDLEVTDCAVVPLAQMFDHLGMTESQSDSLVSKVVDYFTTECSGIPDQMDEFTTFIDSDKIDDAIKSLNLGEDTKKKFDEVVEKISHEHHDAVVVFAI